MTVIDPPMLLAVAALISSVANLVWSFRAGSRQEKRPSTDN